MADYVRALKWPVIAWIEVDIVMLAMSYLAGVMDMLTPAVIAPLTLAFGVWAGYKIVEFGGKVLDVVVAGAVVGVVCAGLTLVGFGLVRGMGFEAILPLAVFAAGFNLFGAFIGGGFALSK